MLCLLVLDETHFARPFDSFGKKKVTEIIQFDASLEGAGILLSHRHPSSGEESRWGAGVIPLVELGFGDDSSYQNTCEFLAATIEVLSCLRCRPKDESYVVVELRGDSVTALQWANSSRFRSTSVNKAATLFTLLVVRQWVVIASVEHVAAEFNEECDDLSRRDRDGRFRNPLKVVPGVRDFRASEDWRIKETLRVCDPRSDLPFHEFWSAV